MAAKKTKKASTPSYPSKIDERLEQLRQMFEDFKVDAAVITYMPNIRYLTNFSGSSATLFVLPDEIHFVTDDRYEEQIKDELFPLPNLKTYISRDVWGTVKKEKTLKKISTLGFEADKMAYSDAVDIRNKIRPVKFKPAPNIAERFTQQKSEQELDSIKKSAQLAEKVYETILKMIKPGMSEIDVATEISYQGRKLGSEGDAFDIIVVSGPRGALVHGQPSTKKIKKNEIVLIDFGCKVNGFCSDISRTFAIGKATKEQKSIYEMLVKAKNEAVKGVRPGMNGKYLDSIARNIVKKAGYGDNFKHSLGHGVGLMVHEKPTISFRLEDQFVPPDSVIAIEPGVYLPDKYGMRVEDMAYVTPNGGELLTNAPSELLII